MNAFDTSRNMRPVDASPLLKALPHMVPTVLDNLHHADTYRISVASALMVGFEHDDSTIEIFTENQKPIKGDEIVNYCAERKALAIARNGHIGPAAKRVLGMVIASTASLQQIHSVNNEVTPTLLPCLPKCMPGMDYYQREGALDLSDEVPIITLGVDNESHKIWAAQAFSLGELYRMRVLKDPSLSFHLDKGYYNIDRTTWHLAANISELEEMRIHRLPAAEASRFVLDLATAD